MSFVAALRCMNKRFIMTLRVVNSEGPLCSGSKSIASRAGNNVSAISSSRCKASDVVHRPLRQRSASWSKLSSCSSL